MSAGRIPGFTAVIPAGGIGSRLWPLSRADAPKFLHDLTGSGQTLLKDTWDRLEPLVGADRVVVVTGRAHRAAVEAQLPDLIDPNVLLESEPRDSTAAIGIAAAVLERREPGVIIGAFAADHVIRDIRGFRRAVEEAVAVARGDLIATIGITPTEPAVGFGYIHVDGELAVDGAPRARRAMSFREKPDLATAKDYLAQGDYLWNAGMYVAKASVVLEWIRRSEPELADGLGELAAVVGRQGAARPRGRPDLAEAQEDRVRLRRRRAGRGRRRARGHPGGLRLGRRRRLRRGRAAPRRRTEERPRDHRRPPHGARRPVDGGSSSPRRSGSSRSSA